MPTSEIPIPSSTPLPNLKNIPPQKPKSKKFLVITAIAVILVFIGSSLLILNNKNNTSSTTETDEDVSLPKADPNIKVDLSPKDPGKTVLLSISSLPNNIQTIEYELTYKTADNKSEGLFGIIKLNSGENSVERELTLGTCSSGVCKYHQVEGKGKLTIKFDGSKGASRFQKEFDLL